MTPKNRTESKEEKRNNKNITNDCLNTIKTNIKVVDLHMNINDRACVAAELKRSGKCNCAQAVVTVLTDQTGLSEDELRNAASGFCAGMGTMEATCGALIGAGMIAGLATNGSGTLRYTRQIITSFKGLCGATTCKELKSTVNGRPLCPCDMCVKNAVLAYGDALGLKDNK